MFNSGIRGKRANDNTGTIASQTQFIQQKYPQPSITGYSVQGSDDTALNPAGGQTVLVNGTGFASGLAVTVNGATISPVTVISPTQISFTSTALAGGSYTLIVYNSTGGAAILVPGLIYSAVPTWTTAAGSIGSFYETTNINTSVVATSDSAITYSLSSGSLPSGATFYANGVITGTSPVESGSSTYTFAVTATDAELQDTTRTFTLTINTDVVTWSSPANNTTYTSDVNVVASNVVLSASSAAGYGITYTANTLPTGLSLTGNTISGTPTVVGSSTTLLTATAATTNRNATRTINWVIQLGTDQYFNLTTLLLNGETSSNYWIQDISTNKFTVTVNGDTKPNAFSPYKTVWSNFFDGTGDYLTYSYGSELAFGTGDFTVEFWISTTSTNLGILQGNTNLGWGIAVVSGTFYWQGVVNQVNTLVVSVSAYLTSEWRHWAVVRSSGTLKLYIGGKEIASISDTRNYTDSAGTFYIAYYPAIGSYVNGYLSNLRIVKGTAVYTGAFTPSTSPLTAIANTGLLTCQSNRFIDNSTNNFTLTRIGDTAVRNFSPFTETDIITGSGYFDGTGDYLTIPANAAFNFGTGDFTIECFYYRSGIKGNSFHDNIIGNRPSSLSSGQWHLYVGPAAAGAFSFTARTPSGDVTITGGTCIENAWNHLAVVKNGTALSLFVNGISVNSTTTSTSIGDSVSNLSIAAFNDGAYPTIGYISNVRVVKGTAVYTANFTPPTSPLTAIANTSLLTLQSRIGENNNRFVDTSGINNIITRNGNTTQGTFSPYSQTGWSVYFDGTGDTLGFTGGSINFPSSTEFTVECWVYKTARDASGYSIVIDGPQNNQFAYDSTTEGSVSLVIAGSGVIGASGTAVQTNAWSHIAWVRQGTNTCRIYVNGVQQGTGTSSTGFDINVIGSYSLGGYEINGYLSNLRIVVGTCLYNNGTTFTPSTTPLTSVANTKLLTCQSNRFVDNGPLNYTISAAGNTSVQSFSPFAPSITTPTSYSGYFDGTGDYLTVPSNAAFQFGTGDFTVEFWLNTTDTAFNIVGLNTAGAGNWMAVILSSTFYWQNAYATTNLFSTSATGILDGAWHHVAVTRLSGTTRVYFDGVSQTSASDSANYNGGGAVQIGSGANGDLLGYISNLRLLKGTALYTANFTPPTSPLTAIANTSLLTCQSNRFIDNSTNNFTITVNGDTVSRTFNPFGITTTTGSNSAYSMANVGGSMYFDGTGDYLNCGSNTLNNLGGDFTVEAWIYRAVSGVLHPIFDHGDYIGSTGILFYVTSGNALAIYTNNALAMSGGTVSVSTWTHVALVRSGTGSGNVKLYLNGVSVGTPATNTATFSGTMLVGADLYNTATTNFMNGYISNIRVLKGTALYTSGFAPPVAPSSSIQNTTLLVSGTNSGIIDYTSKTILETVSTAQLSASVVKFGSASMYFNGSSHLQTSSNFNYIGTGSYTIEFWIYPSSSITSQGIMGSASPNFYGIVADGSGSLFISNTGSDLFTATSANTLTLNTWQHIAIVRNNTTMYMFKNGTQLSTSSTGSPGTQSIDLTGVMIGRCIRQSNIYFTGYLDDVRITKYARYTSNFTAPTSAFITF